MSRNAAMLLSLALLAGCERCAPGTAFSDDRVWPYGILSTPDTVTGVGVATGVFPVDRSEASLCCWLAPSASFDVRIPPKTSALMFTFFEPKNVLAVVRSQTVTISINGGMARAAAPIVAGANLVRVPVLAQEQAHVVGVIVNAAHSFVPAKAGINGDTRELALYLRSVSAW